jgi:exodeoxyribonuclease III
MPTTIATWNINSVRLRAGLVERFLLEHAPDILCLQETKSPVEKLPDRFAALGYRTVTACGFKGYNGVAILSRVALEADGTRQMCGRDDARHCAVRLPSGVVLHNFYVPAGGDEPDPERNPKFDHKLRFVGEMTAWSRELTGAHILVGDLNIAPLPDDVWSHKQLLRVVSHTPVETEAMGRLMQAGGWVDVAREDVRPPARLYSWWSYRAADWAASDRGRRLDHIWTRGGVRHVAGSSRILKSYRGAESPSDHVPVLATFPD